MAIFIQIKTLIFKDLIWISTTYSIDKIWTININSRNNVVSFHWWWFTWYKN